MSKLDHISKKSFPWLLHGVISLMLIDWAVELPSFHGIGVYELALLLLGCTAFLRLCFEKGRVFRAIFGTLGSAKWSVAAIAVYMLLGAATILYAQTPGYALTKYIVVVQMLFVAACMTYYIAQKPDAMRDLYLNFALSAVISAVLAMGKYLFCSDGLYRATISPIRDYNQYSTILLIGWICAAIYTAKLPVSNMRKCTLVAVFTGILMPMVLLAGSRRSYLISFVVSGIVLLYAVFLTVKAVKADKSVRKRAICTFLACVLCVGLASFATTKTVHELFHIAKHSGIEGAPIGSDSAQERLEKDPGLGKRTLIWEAALKELKQYDTKALLIGKGASHSSDFYDNTTVPEIQAIHHAYNYNAENPAPKNWMNPHNLFLQDLLDGGIVLLLSLLAVIGSAIFYASRILRAAPATGIGIFLLYGILLFTFFLSSGRGLLDHKFFWLITILQILECHSAKLSRQGQ